jgi:O-antigen/teichoic acid export membrane protein
MADGMKRLAKETAIYGVSSIVGRSLNWLLTPMYVRVLAGPAEFGIYTNIYGWVALLVVILVYGMETSFFRFINKREEAEPLRVYATALRSVGFTSLLFVILAFAFLTPLSRLTGYEAHGDYVLLMLLVAATDAFSSIPFAYLRYQRRPVRFMTIKLVGIFTNILLNIFFLIVCPRLHQSLPAAVDWFYVPTYSVGYVFVSNALSTAVTVLFLLPSMLPGFRCRGDWALLRGMLRYAFPLLILGIAGIFNQTADKIVFPYLFADKAYALSQLGIYGACFKIAVVLVMFIQAFRYAYEPYIFARQKQGGGAGTAAHADAMKYFILFALFFFLAVMFYLDVLKHFVAPAYYAGLPVVPIVMLGEVFFGIYYNLSFWYKLSDRTHWGAYFSLAGCAVTVVIILLFAPVYGYMACAWASCISNLVMMLLSYVVGQRKYPVPYNWRSALLYFSLAAGLYVAGMYPAIEPLSLRLAYRTGLLIAYAFFTLYPVPCTPYPFSGKEK